LMLRGPLPNQKRKKSVTKDEGARTHSGLGNSSREGRKNVGGSHDRHEKGGEEAKLGCTNEEELKGGTKRI